MLFVSVWLSPIKVQKIFHSYNFLNTFLTSNSRDYNVTKPDAKVMGWRLAGILQFLEKNYMQGIYNQKLSSIRATQMEDVNYRYLHIDKIQFKHIQKRDSVITIVINMFTKVDKKKKFSNDVTLTFTNSLSDDVRANELFSDIVRYIKRDE